MKRVACATHVAVTCLLMLGMWLAVRPAGARQFPDESTSAGDGVARWAAPEGSPADLLAFIRRTKARFVEGHTREERVDFVRGQQRAIWAAAERVLAANSGHDEQAVAWGEKFAALWKLMQLGEPRAGDEAMCAARNLPKDMPQALVDRAAFFRLWGRAEELRNRDKAADASRQLAALASDLQQQIAGGNHDELLIQLATMLPERLQRVDAQLARTTAEQLAAALAGCTEAHAQRAADHLREYAQRQSLIGQRLEVEGHLIGGGELDPKGLAGRVVLVEFWATWCQPCVAEIPNIRDAYVKYHPAGFEVVAISVDDDRALVERFLRNNDIPWPVVCGQSADDSGMRHPMVRKCAVDSVPRSFLVDRTGKVAALDVRGEPLAAAVERLLALPPTVGAPDD